MRAEPEKFIVHPDTVELVVKAVQERGIGGAATKSNKPTVAEQNEDNRSVEELLTSNRDLANKLVHKKLVALDSSKKALRNESVVSLGKIFGILFDKSQIIRGQATEQILHLSKININMSPDDALSAILRMREQDTNSRE